MNWQLTTNVGLCAAVTVGMIVGILGSGHGIDKLLTDYPYITHEDILEALRYAAWLSEERELELAG